MQCSACGETNQPNSRFCLECGVSLEQIALTKNHATIGTGLVISNQLETLRKDNFVNESKIELLHQTKKSERIYLILSFVTLIIYYIANLGEIIWMFTIPAFIHGLHKGTQKIDFLTHTRNFPVYLSILIIGLNISFFMFEDISLSNFEPESILLYFFFLFLFGSGSVFSFSFIFFSLEFIVISFVSYSLGYILAYFQIQPLESNLT